MSTALATQNEQRIAAGAVEDAMVRGNLKDLTPEQRIKHYKSVCESLGLNPLTRPFQYIEFQGALQLYARREASDQLAALHKVRRTIVSKEFSEGLYIVTVRAETPDGRVEESTGALAIDGLKGEARANALMKGETKAKRRATLSIVGLGWLDETEVEMIRTARYVDVDEGGNITGSRPVEVDGPQRRQIAAPSAAQTPLDQARAAFRAVCGDLTARQACERLGIEPNGSAREAITYAADSYGYDLLRKCIEDGVTIESTLRAESGAHPEPAADEDITAPDALPFPDTDPEQAELLPVMAGSPLASRQRGAH